jgi:magnesium chelatase subunit I
MTISVLEALVSNSERRALVTGDVDAVPRIVDFHQALSGITGKIELVFEGEQEGVSNIAKALVGRAVREVFRMSFPDPLSRQSKKKQAQQPQQVESDPYAAVMKFFADGNTITLSDTLSTADALAELDKVPTLRTLVRTYMSINDRHDAHLVSAMEFVLEALHQHSKIAKDESDAMLSYKDMVGSMLGKTYIDDDDSNDDFS